jgi:hypothetical protein
MPAIQLTHLRQKTAVLSEVIDNPDDTVQVIHGILDAYTNRTQRSGQSGEPPPLVEAYLVPKPVLRQILIELKPYAASNPGAVLELCDVFWDEGYLEFQILAAHLIGYIRVEDPSLILDRIITWSQSTDDSQVQEALFNEACQMLVAKDSEYLIARIGQLIIHGKGSSKILGLQALLPIVRAPSYENFPALLNLLGPQVREATPETRPYVLSIIVVLAHRTPRETAYFLRQNMAFEDNTNTAWFIRHSKNEFSPELKRGLEDEIRAHRST